MRHGHGDLAENLRAEDTHRAITSFPSSSASNAYTSTVVGYIKLRSTYCRMPPLR